jgi:hypothetical protein
MGGFEFGIAKASAVVRVRRRMGGFESPGFITLCFALCETLYGRL